MIVVRWALVLATLTCIAVVVHTGRVNGVALLALIFAVAVGATFPRARRMLPIHRADDCPCLVDHAEAEDDAGAVDSIRADSAHRVEARVERLDRDDDCGECGLCFVEPAADRSVPSIKDRVRAIELDQQVRGDGAHGAEPSHDVPRGNAIGWVVVERRPDRDVIVSASVQWLEILVTRERAERAAARLTAERAMRAARASHGMHWPNYTYFAAPVLAEEDLSRLDRRHGVGSRS